MTDTAPLGVRLTDPDDARLSPLRDLPGRAAAPGESLVVEGAVAVQRALAGPTRVRMVVGTASQLSRLEASALPEDVFVVDNALLQAVMGFPFHRGIVAVANRPPPEPPGLPALLAAPRLTVLVLERLADPANVGAVIRTAAALGTDLVVCDAAGADPYGRRALRASMGHALVRPPWVADPALAVRRLAASGVAVWVATVEPRARPLPGIARGQRIAVVLGNEGDGVSPELAALADDALTIPIADGADSLNVAAAAAIVLYALQ